MHDLYKQFLDPPSKLFKKVNLCLKKKRKKERKNLFAFTSITRHFVPNCLPNYGWWKLRTWDLERARENWDSN